MHATEVTEALGTATRHVIDAVGSIALIATLLGWLPQIAALLALVCYCITIYDRVRYGPKR